MQRGKSMSGIVWGKIQVTSDEGLTEVKKVLVELVKTLGYPEEEIDADGTSIKEKEEELKKELSSMGDKKSGEEKVVRSFSEDAIGSPKE